MSSDESALVYPNPGSRKAWLDERGRQWERRGSTAVDEKRLRRLLRADDVALATWSAGRVRWYSGADKESAAAELVAAAAQPDDVVASDWRGVDGSRLLLLEHHC